MSIIRNCLFSLKSGKFSSDQQRGMEDFPHSLPLEAFDQGMRVPLEDQRAHQSYAIIPRENVVESEKYFARNRADVSKPNEIEEFRELTNELDQIAMRCISRATPNQTFSDLYQEINRKVALRLDVDSTRMLRRENEGFPWRAFALKEIRLQVQQYRLIHELGLDTCVYRNKKGDVENFPQIGLGVSTSKAREMIQKRFDAMLEYVKKNQGFLKEFPRLSTVVLEISRYAELGFNEPLNGYARNHLMKILESQSVPKINPYNRLGRGKSGEVFLSEFPRQLRSPIATKKMAYTEGILDVLRNEVRIWIKLDHITILKVIGVKKADQIGSLCVDMEYFPGKELTKVIQENWEARNGTEAQLNLYQERIRRGVFQAAQGLAYMASLGIGHYDVKPENMLIDDDDMLKIIDMGFASEFSDLKNSSGTPLYMAPEIMKLDSRLGFLEDAKNEYNKTSDPKLLNEIEELEALVDVSKADVWSLGIVLYYALTGEELFDQTDLRSLCCAIRMFKPINLDVSVALKDNHVSKEAIDLLKQMLQKDSPNRISMEEVLDHPYFADLHFLLDFSAF